MRPAHDINMGLIHFPRAPQLCDRAALNQRIGRLEREMKEIMTSRLKQMHIPQQELYEHQSPQKWQRYAADGCSICFFFAKWKR